MSKRKYFRENTPVRILAKSHFMEQGTIWRVWLDRKTIDVKYKGGLLTLKRTEVELL